jgi:hypothetical protein
MNRFFLFILPILMLCSVAACKKTVEKKAEDYIIEIMTDGRWYMYDYRADGLDYTFLFSGYEFQFHDNETVDAIKGLSVSTGSWKGDIINYTITANFPSATEPLSRLNNTWKITDSYINAVFAEATFGTELHKIQLMKK